MREKQEEPIPYMLILLSNLSMHHSKSAAAYDCPGGLHCAQVAKKADGIMVCVVVLPQSTMKPHTATCSLSHQWDGGANQKGKTCRLR